MKLFWVILITAIIAGGAGVTGTYYLMDQKASNDKITLQSGIDDVTAKYQSCQASSEKCISDLTSSTSITDTDNAMAQTALSDFLTQKETRSLEKAKPYMTNEFYTTYTQETFAGTSSPSMGSFEITTFNAKTVNNTYVAGTKLYYYLQGEKAGYFPNTYEVTKVGTKYLVSKETLGDWVESAE